MSDNPMSQPQNQDAPTTIAEVLAGLEPIGDLDQFAIKDLKPEDEDEFFAILENA